MCPENLPQAEHRGTSRNRPPYNCFFTDARRRAVGEPGGAVMQAFGLAAAATLMLVVAAAMADAADAVAVYRGPGSGPLPQVPGLQPDRALVGGKTIWAVNGDGSVTGCRIETAINVGQRVV